jgi:hypothetical protein
MTDWYWCLDHEAAEPEERACSADRRWGPYPTREAAEHWREQAAARNEQWDADDRAWEGDDD